MYIWQIRHHVIILPNNTRVYFQSPPGCKLKVYSADANGYTIKYGTSCYHYGEVMYATGHFEHGQR